MDSPSSERCSDSEIAILGGGPAGLACGWALEELGRRDYNIFEKSLVHGGNARTVQFRDFRYDTGPHRFHARDPEATRRICELMGPDLHQVNAPARIYWRGRFVDFPLRPGQILRNGGLGFAVRAATDLVKSRLMARNNGPPQDFSAYANGRFGKTIADTFLIPFSQRLWGLPGHELSADIAGRRLPGFSVTGIIKEALAGSQKSDHLEGCFLYPRLGYGQIADKMAGRLSSGRLRYNHRAVSIETRGDQVVSVGVKADGQVRQIRPQTAINTLPISMVARMMDPPAPEEVLKAAARLRFRNVVLVTLFIDQESVSDAAATYFQNPKYNFTRAHEPRNRSRAMSPEGQTSLVVEFPCFPTDEIWDWDEDRLVDGLVQHLEAMGLLRESRVFASDVNRLDHAYPVYSRDYKAWSQAVLSHLRQFKNLWTLGRSGSFFYGHVHDFVTDAFGIARAVDRYIDQETGITV
ncbi:MAG TPA: FAD-dependent oxidoreductase [Dehalococcoidia bacterium]|nr:FAD-dependent oxidoreductase [Dehalococcoidia bacterium]